MSIELVYSATEAPLNQECLNSLKCQSISYIKLMTFPAAVNPSYIAMFIFN